MLLIRAQLKSCHICNKQVIYLKAHLSRHVKTRSHICGTCGYTLKEVSSLRKRMLIHSGHKPFTCELCDKGFTNNENLFKHMFMLVYTGDKLFSFKFCFTT